jgi:hypothetical protein
MKRGLLKTSSVIFWSCACLMLVYARISVGQEASLVDSASSFIPMYQHVFSAYCNNSTCHGGTFEPNLSSMFSSYNTLVYHPLVKNAKNQKFEYRVIPYDTANSVLFQRLINCCFAGPNDRMPAPLVDGLPDFELNLVKNWIMDGAPDPLGRRAGNREALKSD